MGILERLFGAKTRDTSPSIDEATARAIVERVAAAVDKRLLLVPDCQKRLRDVALTTLGHVRAVVTAIPGPVDIGAQAWRDDPAVRPLFARGEDAAAAFGRESAVRKFFESSTAEACFALLGLEHVERRVLAPALEGDIVRQDVARTAVSFGHPRVLAPAATERTTRVDIGKAAVDHLAMQALARVTALDTEKRELEKEQALLKMRLQLARSAGRGLADLESGAAASKSAEITRALDANRKALSRHTPGELLDRLVDILRDVLGHPDHYLRIEPRTVTLDAMNLVVEEGAPDAVATLRFQRLQLADGRAFAMFVARFPRAELAASTDRIVGADKYL
jgi:hypothetical protein